MQGFSERGGWWVAAQVAILALVGASWLAWSGDWGPAAAVAGWSAAGAGAALAGWGLLSLGGNLSPYPSPKEGSELIERGPYRLVRHPIYGGIVAAAAGISLADGNAGGLVFTLALLILFLGKSGFEEQRLLVRYPAYGDYRERVRRRLLPGII